MNIGFYIKAHKDNNLKKGTIMICVTHKKQRFRVSTGITIPLESWDVEKQKIKKNFAASVEYNGILLKQKNELHKMLAKAIEPKNGLTLDDIKKEFVAFRDADYNKEVKAKGVFDVYTKFIEDCKLSKGDAVIKSYKTTLNHLIAFETKIQSPLEFNSFTIDFYNQYINFLAQKMKLTNNSIGKDIKNIKVFLRWALEKEYHNNYNFLKFKVIEEESDSFVLHENEVKSIENLRLKTNSTLDKVRDLFLIMIYTSLRVSDLLELSPANFDMKNGLIHINAKKTKGQQIIAITPKLQKILSKYPDLMLPKLTSQEINRTIKEIGKLAGMTEPFQVVKYSGKKQIIIEKPRYEFLSTKIGRRTNITLSLKANVPEAIVRKQSGHKTNKHFVKYIKMSGEDVKEAMSKVEIWQ